MTQNYESYDEDFDQDLYDDESMAHATIDYITTRAKVTPKNASVAWTKLTQKEKNYAYFMQKADWAGAKMVLHQVSYEAPAIFVLLHSFFQDNNYQKLKQKIVDGNTIKDSDFLAFKAYAAAFYQYMGNYHSFGSMKFRPNMEENMFRTILLRHPLYLSKSAKGNLYRKIVNEVYPQIKDEMFDTKAPYTQLGYPHEGGITSYFS